MRKAVLLFTFYITSILSAFGQEKITIIGNQKSDPSTKFMQGFLHGGARFTDSVKVAKLKPEFWRIGAYVLAGSSYQETKKFNPKITVNINDLYMIVNNITNQTQSQPWENNWAAWDNLVTAIANNSKNNNEPVDYWDVWGEPDNFWTGNYTQWIEMYRRTDSIITSIIPNAKIIGPEFGFGACNFNTVPILQFLDSLYAVGTTISGVSWHEFCNPQDLPVHVKQLREALAARPWLGNLEILIPEYAGPTNHTIPAWNVAWLYYLEKSKVDWVSHSCWNETDGNNNWSNCEYGLNGLFIRDNVTPQPNYWVHRAYAELDTLRLTTTTTHPKTVALASINQANQEMKILIGRFDNPNLGQHNAPSNVVIQIKDYPFCASCTMPYAIQRIPSNNVPYSIALNSPLTAAAGTVYFSDNTLSIMINDFIDGDAYIIFINPASGSLFTSTNVPLVNNQFKIYPNPGSNNIFLEFATDENKTIQIFNTLGSIVKETDIYHSTQIDISQLPNGVYYIRNSTSPAQIVKFLKH
jgi:hypothetical protein